MADRTGLKLVGFVFATVVVAVVMTTAFVVKGHADGRYVLEGAATTQVELRR